MSWSTELQNRARVAGGVLVRGRLIADGIPTSAIDGEIRRGRLVAIHPGVYRSAAGDETVELRRRAALAACGDDAVLSHRSAASRHGLLGGTEADQIELTTTHHRRSRLNGVHLHRSTHLPDHHVRSIDGLATTTVERTLADVGKVLPSPLVSRLVERAVIDCLTTVSRLWELLDVHACRGRSGVATLRFALEHWMFSDRPPDSVLEVAFARLVRHHDLPEPHYQLEIRDGGEFIARVDAAWPERLVLVEVDGLHAHASATALGRDLARQNALVRLGWTVLRFDWPAVVRSPARVADEIRAVLATRPGSRDCEPF